MKNWMQQLKESYIKMLTETESNDLPLERPRRMNPPPAPPLPLGDPNRSLSVDTHVVKDDNGVARYYHRQWNPDGTERPLRPITKDDYDKIQINAANDPSRGGQSGRFGAPREAVPNESPWSQHHHQTQFAKQEQAELKKREKAKEGEDYYRYGEHWYKMWREREASEAGYSTDQDGTVTKRMP